jgi:hypothetical protein
VRLPISKREADLFDNTDNRIPPTNARWDRMAEPLHTDSSLAAASNTKPAAETMAVRMTSRAQCFAAAWLSEPASHHPRRSARLPKNPLPVNCLTRRDENDGHNADTPRRNQLFRTPFASVSDNAGKQNELYPYLSFEENCVELILATQEAIPNSHSIIGRKT